ncbi:monocarboxylate transporter 6-like isoform X1 [Lingula anatina]|uniref:Monocarboxylate transporter 6-like isoform X1 n=1 Tax=Lingula anatina TaxID=7574 RepID=A0A1S3HBZ9_LINAN|nr:monocarboxylate transporter 6-like isoform X1 [Lingula anatina]|eukprot:XP_013383520.1 monocarboxylate transporter 6-like isoform X1 [Lingula anatina]
MYYGWKFVFASSMYSMTFNGFYMSWGVFNAAFAGDPDLGGSLAVIGLIPSIMYASAALVCLSAKEVSVIIPKLKIITFAAVLVLGLVLSSVAPSTTFLIFTHGIMTGFSITIIRLEYTFRIAEWFPWDHRYHVLATSFNRLAMVAGTVVYANLIEWLFRTLGWRYGYLVLGGFFLVSVLLPLGSFQRPGTQAGPENQEADKKVFGCGQQICILSMWFLSNVANGIGHSNSTGILIKHLEDMGLPSYVAVRFMTTEAVCNFFSRLATTLVGDRVKGHILKIHAVLALILAANMLLGYAATSPTAFIPYSIVLGFGQGPLFSAMYASCSEVTSGQNVQQVYVICSGGTYVGMSVAPYLSGAIYDWQNSYSLVFVILAVGYFVCGLAMFAIVVINKISTKT